jgi:MFS family permease
MRLRANETDARTRSAVGVKALDRGVRGTKFQAPSLVEPLRIPRFRALWLASLLYNIGHLVQVVAAAWLMLELTESALWVGMTAGAPSLPLLFLSLPAGAMADLLDRRRILLGSTGIMLFAVTAIAALLALNLLNPGLLLGLTILGGVGVAFFAPAWQATLPDLVPPSLVPDAISLNATSAAVAWVVGPTVGGALFAVVGPAWTFIISAAGYASLLAVTIALHLVPERQRAKLRLRVAVASGFRYMRFSPAYRRLLTIAALFGFTSAALRALLPSITSKELQGGAAMYGLLLAMLGTGAVLGAVTRRRSSRALLAAMIPASITGYGVAGLAISTASHPAQAATGLLVAGAFWAWIFATLNATIQLLTPPWVRARAISFYLLAFFGLLPVGSVVAGFLGEILGSSHALLACSSMVVLLGVTAFRMPVPVLEHVVPPKPAGWQAPLPAAFAPEGRVVIETTWSLDDENVRSTLPRITLLRAVRLRTGASGWRLYRDLDDPNLFTELIAFPSWEEYVQSAAHVDVEGAAKILYARDLDPAGKPHQRRLIEVNVTGGTTIPKDEVTTPPPPLPELR